jgi:hypothetical protein
MKNEMMKNEMSSVGTQRLRLPLQTAPVERTLAATAALSGQGGVVSSGFWDDVGSFIAPIARTAGPAIGQALAGLI